MTDFKVGQFWSYDVSEKVDQSNLITVMVENIYPRYSTSVIVFRERGSVSWASYAMEQYPNSPRWVECIGYDARHTPEWYEAEGLVLKMDVKLNMINELKEVSERHEIDFTYEALTKLYSDFREDYDQTCEHLDSESFGYQYPHRDLNS